jgi:hypothetical protein
VDVCLDHVPTARSPSGHSDNGVRMNLGLVLVDRDIAGERQGFDLLLYGNALILFGINVKEAKNRVAERTERGEMAGV